MIWWTITFFIRLVLIYGFTQIYTGVTLPTLWATFVFVVVLAFLNITLKPILKLLTLPVNILTLGLFSLVINAVVILFADTLIADFAVTDFWAALVFGLVIGVINTVIGMIR